MTALQSSGQTVTDLSKEGDDIVSSGDSPYDFVPSDLRPSLDEAMSQVPVAKRYFERGRATKAGEELREAGFASVASALDLYMPHKFSR